MPHVINGIGTWYYGKRNRHKVRGVCESCGAVTDLESHDTTLYFVVFFVPLVPLGGKRILDLCPACSRHKSVSLAKWARLKTDAMTEVLDKLTQTPDDKETILAALGTATGYQDEALFDRLRVALVDQKTDDADIQAALGRSFTYFARHDEAADAFGQSLAMKDDPAVREALGLSMLRLGRPADAGEWFDHIYETGDINKTWMPYQQAVAHQAAGEHPAALAIADRVFARFPDLERDKDWKRVVKTSTKYKDRAKPVGRSLLQEAPGAGTRAGSRVGSLLPKLIPVGLVLAFAGWHVWSATTRAAARPVYLVSGAPAPYTVLVNGERHALRPGQVKPITVPEGVVTLAPAAAVDAVEPADVPVETSFWTRPYSRPTVVLNPDRLAVLVVETSIYAENPPTPPPDEYKAGAAGYDVAGLNHVFEPFPLQIKAKKSETVTRRRLGFADTVTFEDKLRVLADLPDKPDRVTFAKRWLAFAPADALALAWFATTAPKADVVAFLKPKLAARPLDMEAHRAYQSVARTGTDAVDLKPEYEKLADELKRDPDALYLLSRVCDGTESLTLLEEAADAGKPAHYAHYALGFHHLCRAEYKKAVAELAKAGPLVEKGEPYSTVAADANLAAGNTRAVAALLAADAARSGNRFRAALKKLHLAARSGKPAEVAPARSELLGLLPAGAGADTRETLARTADLVEATAARDRTKYLAAAARLPKLKSVRAAIIKGDLAAARALTAAGEGEDDTVEAALVLLATPAGQDADAKKDLRARLAAGGADERTLADIIDEKVPLNTELLTQLPTDPRRKRALVAALSRWFPDEAKELRDVVRPLDFHRDDVSLCLAPWLAGP